MIRGVGRERSDRRRRADVGGPVAGAARGGAGAVRGRGPVLEVVRGVLALGLTVPVSVPSRRDRLGGAGRNRRRRRRDRDLSAGGGERHAREHNGLSEESGALHWAPIFPDAPVFTAAGLAAGPTIPAMSRFASSPDAAFRALNDSISFDIRLAPYDVAQSRAHATMLAARGIISDAERDDLLEGLGRVEAELSGRLIRGRRQATRTSTRRSSGG